MSAYYNENDPHAAETLRELIRAGEIADGEVDTRSIEDVTPNDVKGFTQCHWFAGIGGWSRALRLAGWPDSRPVWTGSCPCQPFSQAGKKKGMDDARHLWPVWRRLISDCLPGIVLGEQVASALKIGPKDEEVFCLLNRETPIGIQKIWGALKGWSEASLQSMSERVRKELALSIGGVSQRRESQAKRKRSGLSISIHSQEQGDLFGKPNQVNLQEKINKFRFGSAHSRVITKNFEDEMRSYWLSPEGKSREAAIQQRFNRSNNSLCGICLQQYSSSLFCNQCGHGVVGAGKTGRDNQGMEGLIDELSTVARKTGSKFERKVFHGWLDLVFDDLENSNYACGAAIIPAAGVGAPHLRERVWFVGICGQPKPVQLRTSKNQRFLTELFGKLADLDSNRSAEYEQKSREGKITGPHNPSDRQWVIVNLAHNDSQQRNGRGLGQSTGSAESANGREPLLSHSSRSQGRSASECPDKFTAGLASVACDLADSDSRRLKSRSEAAARSGYGQAADAGSWDDCVWLPCTDGKWRPTQSGIFPLAYGIPAGVGSIIAELERMGCSAKDAKRIARDGAKLLRAASSFRTSQIKGYGNAIVPQVAAEFIMSVM